LVDWLDSDSYVMFGGVEDGAYVGEVCVYVVVNVFLVDISEFVGVRGFMLSIVEVIVFFVCVRFISALNVINFNMLCLE
jgi:Type II secretory pathway, component PulK